MIEELTVYWTQLTKFLSFDAALLAEPEMIFRLALQCFLLFGSAFFSGSKTALFSLSDVDLEQLRRKRHRRADLLHGLLSQPRRLIISILCGNELINIGATVNMTGILLLLYGPERTGLINILVMVPLLLLFGEIDNRGHRSGSGEQSDRLRPHGPVVAGNHAPALAGTDFGGSRYDMDRRGNPRRRSHPQNQ